MLGYLSPNRARLTASEYREYFKGYCGLCEQLKRDYGRWGRFLVNRDAVVLMVLSEAQTLGAASCRDIRCGVNWRRHAARGEPKVARYAAAVTVMLFIGRLADTAHDARGPFGVVIRWLCWLLMWLLSSAKQKAEAVLDAQGLDPGELSRLLAAQRAIEGEPHPGLEASAEACSEGVGLLFAHTARLAGAEGNVEQLHELGRAVGALIYLSDALEDLDDDRRRGRFNPLLIDGGPQKGAALSLGKLLREAHRRAARIISSIGWARHGQLLVNIIVDGLWSRVVPREVASTPGLSRPWLGTLAQPVPADCDCDCPCDCGDTGGPVTDACDNFYCGEGLGESCAACDVPCGKRPTKGKKPKDLAVDELEEGLGSDDGEVVPRTKVFAEASDGYWYEAVVQGAASAGRYTVEFQNGVRSELSRSQITLGTDPSPPGFEKVEPGAKVRAATRDGGWAPGTIVSRFGRVFAVELDDGRTAWCDTSKLRVVTEPKEVGAVVCTHCGATVEAGQRQCSFCGTQVRS